MDAVYISPNSFKVSKDKTLEFVKNRRVRCKIGPNTFVYATIVSSSYSIPDTTVIINESELTSNLSEVLYGIVQPGSAGSLPDHDHSSEEGTGGPVEFIDLADTPTTYSGSEGKYAKITASGIEFDDAASTFKDLVDTPTTYSGSASKVVKVNNAETGLEFIDSGNTWYTGTGAPSTSIGIGDDCYYESVTDDVYIKEDFYTYSTWNPSDKSTNITLSNGNLTALGNAGYANVRSYYGNSSGKWYWEVKVTDIPVSNIAYSIGFGTAAADLDSFVPTGSLSYYYSGVLYDQGSLGGGGGAYGDSYGLNDIIGVALDLDNGKCWFSKNGVWQKSGDPTDPNDANAAFSGLSNTFYSMLFLFGTDTHEGTANFGPTTFSGTVPDGYATGWRLRTIQWEKIGNINKTFLTLDDTPSSYSGNKGKFLKVSEDESELEFTTVSGLVLYGTGLPPAAAPYEDGTVFYRYIA